MRLHSVTTLIFGISLAVICNTYSRSATANQSLIEKGKTKYNAFCINCHGADGSGTGPASGLSGVPTGDLSDKAYMSLLTDEEIIDRVAYGEERYPYLQMPGWRTNLDPEMIKAVVAYGRTLEVDKGPLKSPTPQERLKRFKTDPLERGRIYYLRYCSGCHGETGGGDGRMAPKALKKPVALSSPEVAAKISYGSVKEYITDASRWDRSYMPVFQETEILDKLKEIVAYIKMLPTK